MKQNKRLNRRIILSSFMLIIVCSAFSSQSTDPTQNSVVLNEPTQNPISSAFTGSARNFTISQFATAISSTYDVNPTTLTSFTLTSGWTAENITIKADNVTRYRNLVQNPTCDYNYGQSEYTNWEYYTSNSPQLPLNVQDNRLSLDVGYGTITPDEIAYFNQTINIDEEEVSTEMVELSFDARMYESPGDSGLYLFGAIIIGGVEHNLTIDTTTDTTEIYQTYNMQYYLSDEGQELPNDIEFRFGAYVNQTLVYGSDPTHHDVHFDNIEFNVYTYVNQSYALIAQDQDDLTDYDYTNSSSGQGEFSIGVQKSYGSTQDVEFQIRQNSTLEGLVQIENLTIQADLSESSTTDASLFSDGEFPGSDDIVWTFDADTSIPGSYFNRYILVEKPSDWLIISVVDPFFTNQTLSCTDLNYGSTNFTIPTSIYTNGIWEIRARSKSWFDEAKLEYWNGASFIEKTDFYFGEDFHVKVNINDTVTLTNTNINFTIYSPNGTVFYEENEEPSSFEYYFGNFTVDQNMTTGIYTAEVAWTNNQTPSMVDKVGYKTFEFGIFHSTQFSTVDTLIETVPGEPLLILVSYEDTDVGEGIDLATVEYNSTFGDSGQLTYIGSGYYFLELDTSSYDYTDYYLSFNASKTYYQNHTVSDLIQLSIEREGMVLDVPRQVNSVSTNTYAQFNFNLTGEISEAFLSADDLTTDWAAWYEINPLALGQYELNVSTTGVTTSSFPETFVINIFANKTDYTNTTDIVLLQVNPIVTAIAANQTFIEVSQGTPFSVKVNLTDTGLGSLVSGADCEATWTLGTTITPVGDEFVIDYDTTGLDLDQYSSLITINKSGYQTKNVIISVLINPVQTVIASNTSFIRVSQGSQFTVKVNYTEYYGGAIIPAATCTVDWLKYFDITPVADGFEILFNTTDLSLDQYTATVQINKTGFETQNVFITVLVDPISTAIAANESLITVEPGKVFSVTVNYTDVGTGFLIDGANCTVTWNLDTNITDVLDEFNIDFDTTGLALGQYSALIQISKAGYETQNLFISVLVNPIRASIAGNITLIQVEQGKVFSITANYTDFDTGFLISGASCIVTWGRDTNITDVSDEFVIDFDTTSLALGQYTAIVQISKTGYETQSLFITVLIEPVSSSLTILFAEPAEFYVGDQATISVEYIVDSLSFDGGTVTLEGDIEGTLTWNGTAYTFSFDTSDLDPKIYATQIFAQAAGVQTQIYDLYIRIQPVEYDITLSGTSLTVSDDGPNMIFITVYDSSHGVYVTDATITCNVGEVSGNLVSLGNGTYTLDVDQFGLDPAINPYSLDLEIMNPNGEDESFHITIVVPRDLNVLWWIAGAVGGTILLGLSSLFIYFRYIKQTRFQRDVAFIQKNIANVSKVKGRSEPSRDKIVSDIINKEIDQLL